MILDFTKSAISQDMIGIIMNEKNLTKEEAVSFAVNEKIAQDIIDFKAVGIAYSTWGYMNPGRMMITLQDPIIDVKFNEEQIGLIKKVMKSENAPLHFTIGYFLLLTMYSFGYFI